MRERTTERNSSKKLKRRRRTPPEETDVQKLTEEDEEAVLPTGGTGAVLKGMLSPFPWSVQKIKSSWGYSLLGAEQKDNRKVEKED